MKHTLPNFLPGRLVLEPGTSRDYVALEQFHYLPKRPATWAQVWRVRYIEPPPFSGGAEHRGFAVPPVWPPPAERCSTAKSDDSRTVAVGVLSYPTARSRARERLFNLQPLSFGEKIRFGNRMIRTISRVVVHPQFRSLGLSTLLVECLIENCPTRYIEASAMMGRAHPFFERAGMTRIEPDDPEAPIYYIFDRESQEQQAQSFRAAA